MRKIDLWSISCCVPGVLHQLVGHNRSHIFWSQEKNLLLLSRFFNPLNSIPDNFSSLRITDCRG